MSSTNLKYTALIIALVIIAGSTGFILLRNGLTHFRLTIEYIDSMLHTTADQRKAELYKAYGYGYFTYINNQIPDEKFTPLLRYFDWSRNLIVILPEGSSTNTNMLLAFDVDEDAFSTNLIADASIENIDENKQIWSFSTLYDYDTLQEFRLIPDTCTAESISLTINIYPMMDSSEPYNSTSSLINCKSKEELTVKLTEEISHFSMGRGASKFKIEIISDPPVTLSKLAAYGIKINTSDYILINKLDGNYTFIKTEFLDKITSENDTDWLEFINSIKNV